MLSHSLGNKFMQGLFETLNKQKRIERYINYWILVAPDIENTIFSEENTHKNINKFVKNIVVYYSNRDLALSLTGAYNKDKRLGKYGLQENDLDKSNIIVIDVESVMVCNGLLSKIIQHNYFFTNNMVWNDINDIIFKEDKFRNKKESTLSNSYKLLKT